MTKNNGITLVISLLFIVSASFNIFQYLQQSSSAQIKDKITELESKSSDLTAQNEKLNQQNSSLKEKLEAAEQLSQNYKKESLATSNELFELKHSKNEIETEMKAQYAELEAKQSESTQTIDSLNLAKTNLEKKNDNLIKARQTLEESNKNLQNANSELEVKIKNLETANISLAQKSTKLEEENKSLVEANKNLEDANSLLEEKNRNLAIVKESFEEANNNLEEANASLEQKNRNLKIVKDSFEEANENLEAANASLEQKNRNLKIVKDSFEEANENLEAANASLEQKNRNLKIVKDSFEEANENLEAANASLEAKYNKQLMINAEAVEKFGGEAEQQIADLKNEISQLKKKSANLENQVKQLAFEKSNIEKNAQKDSTRHSENLSRLQEQYRNQEAELNVVKENLAMTLFNQINFNSGGTRISGNAIDVLQKLGNFLSQNSSLKVQIAGHSDNEPISLEYVNKYPSNWELSAARAATVINYLYSNYNIPPERMELKAYSFHKPLYDNSTEEGRKKNRRVEIFLKPENE
ncbi:exported hypothetical protein [Desulfamplus magnetovallimortis]|uniref:OmpA-like domain-containing protein n=1 Tax=Desulfamplus magnetovallimortis TaxID=1246637 RepID=A0A1W1HAN5_9BACT|nr:OmpA family protein [Desulfamplus magnetovallimortis]SLM29503.1 exported hypothetical protein [Desulfamplus magnetovallimortis]